MDTIKRYIINLTTHAVTPPKCQPCGVCPEINQARNPAKSTTRYPTVIAPINFITLFTLFIVVVIISDLLGEKGASLMCSSEFVALLAPCF